MIMIPMWKRIIKNVTCYKIDQQECVGIWKLPQSLADDKERKREEHVTRRAQDDNEDSGWSEVSKDAIEVE